jgi:polysaccharide pyruvyl transferase WcaK-like protein
VTDVRPVRKEEKVWFFGNFGTGNFGNEATLQAIHRSLCRLLPDADFTCVCTHPTAATAMHNIRALPIRPSAITAWTPKNRVARWLRKVMFGIPSELYRWWVIFRALKGVDALIIPGTGLLTDTRGLLNWGPYGLFQWVVTAKLSGCKLLFVSVGVGPLYGYFGRLLTKSALSLADFRSYRDVSSREYLKSIRFSSNRDSVYPDLVFSLPSHPHPSITCNNSTGRRIIGLGLMHHGEMYGDNKPDSIAYQQYLECLVKFVSWALCNDYDIRLLIGELSDPVSEFANLLEKRLPLYNSSRVNKNPITSVDDLQLQFADMHLVVATRFHNVLFALLEQRPTIAISFHDKCSSLMDAMGLSTYCMQINTIDHNEITELVLSIEANYDNIKNSIANRSAEMRGALEEQYTAVARTVRERAAAAHL